MRKKILLLGGGGHCGSVVDTLLRVKEFDEIGIVSKIGDPDVFGKIPVVGNDDDIPELKKKGFDYAFVTVGSVGNTALREKLYALIKSYGFMIPNIIDPSAVVSENCKLGNGIFIGKNAVVNAGAEIGDASIINTAAVIEHDCHIGEFVHISPAAVLCGNVTIGRCSHIGAGSVVIQGRNIGDHTVIGAGSTVIRDADDGKTYVGTPAKAIK